VPAAGRAKFVSGMRAPRRLQGSAFGVGFTVAVDKSELLAAVRERMPPSWQPGHGGRPQRRYTVSHGADGLRVDVGAVLLRGGLSHLGALDVLESDLQLFVAQHAREFVFVHAGVVGVHGRAVVFPGTSGAGKTTLVRALVEAGATYYSDEYALLDAKGRVHPYARALSVRTDGADAKVRVPIDDLSTARSWAKPLPLGRVVQTEYSRGARWKPYPLTRGEVVLALLSHTVPARERPREVLATLARAAVGTVGFRSVRGSAGRVANALLSLAAEGQRGARLPLHVHPARIRSAAPSPRRRDSGSRR
jgi:hypothetical protein